MKVNYKSDDGLSTLEMAAYFWNEKGDPSRLSGWEYVTQRIPELKNLWEAYCTTIEEAEEHFNARFQAIIDEHNPKEWGNEGHE